jgi:hypothetical protein
MIDRSLAIGFVVVTLVALIYSSWIIGFRYALVRRGNVGVRVQTLRLVLGGFLLVTAMAGIRGWFLEDGGTPIRLYVLSGLALIVALVVAIRDQASHWLGEIPESWLVYAMVFRIAATAVVAFIATRVGGFWPDLVMIATADIALGISSIALGKFVEKRHSIQLESAWSVLGLITWCALGGYYARLMSYDSSAALVLRVFPAIWLPVFVFPHGLALHVMLIRKIRQVQSSAASPDETSSRSSGLFGSTRNSQPSP